MSHVNPIAALFVLMTTEQNSLGLPAFLGNSRRILVTGQERKWELQRKKLALQYLGEEPEDNEYSKYQYAFFKDLSWECTIDLTIVTE